MKRLLVCLDGTWNNASREVEKGSSRVYRPTNVLKVARAARNVAQDGTLQITYYDAGVGAMNRAPDWRARLIRRADNVLGGGWGAGFEVNIEEAYTFLSNNYQLGDHVFIFGFSRGAAQARSLSGLIDWVGGFPPKRDAYYVPRLYTQYLSRRGAGRAAELIDEINHWKEQNKARPITIQPARVRFLGVWDTVLALGSRFASRRGSFDERLAFHCPARPPENVDRIRHAVAIDEARHDFQAELFDATDSSAEDRWEQRWFVGSHSNVGGGLADDSLANQSLRWMCREAMRAGLEFDSEFIKHYRADPLGAIQPKAVSYQIVDTLLQPFRGFAGRRILMPHRDVLDESVIRRLIAIPAEHKRLVAAYRPNNLLRYLADDQRYDSQLSPEIMAEVHNLRLLR